MCGILGRVSTVPTETPEFLSLLDKLTHRGPDDYGVWLSHCRRVSFGHRRLSVMDLSEASRQPMSSADGRYTIVFNGEIYNFEQLRAELSSLGHRISTSGDTEVLLSAFLQWGARCVEKLNGMFAFVVYDAGTSTIEPRVFFARDRAGEKPLYLLPTRGGFWFASELKALPHSSTINLSALNFYLSLGYIPGDLCLFEGVQKIPPAHCGTFSLASGRMDVSPYWALPPHSPRPGLEGDDLAREAGALIEDSVRLRLVADVPVGILLSGGLDSSLVAAAAARVSANRIETFTIAFPGSDLDEAHHAKKVADFLGARHHILPLDRPSLDLLSGLSPFIDEPIADSSILPAWLVFGLARQQVTVALGGDGGDELFGGYTDYLTSLSDQNRFRRFPSVLLTTIAKIASRMPAGVKGRNRLASLQGGPLQQMIWGTPYFDVPLRKKLFKAEARNALRGFEDAPEKFLLSLFFCGTTPLDRMTRTHFRSILPDDFLFKVDRASMAHSLEVRAPMLDHRLVEFCFSQVPDQWKVKDGESRKLQRLLAKNWLPPDLDTKRKQGFSIPLNEWLRAEGGNRLMSRMECLPNVIDLDEVKSLVQGHLDGRANGGRLFALIMLSTAMKNLSS